jgi:anti-anti-sigma factor
MSATGADVGPAEQPDSPGALTVTRERVGAAVVLHVHGEIDMVSTGLLDAELQAAEDVTDPPALVVLDLSDVLFLASMGLALLVAHHERCAEHGIALRVVAAHRQVLRPIEITGLDQKLALVRTVDEAVAL